MAPRCGWRLPLKVGCKVKYKAFGIELLSALLEIPTYLLKPPPLFAGSLFRVRGRPLPVMHALLLRAQLALH